MGRENRNIVARRKCVKEVLPRVLRVSSSIDGGSRDVSGEVTRFLPDAVTHVKNARQDRETQGEEENQRDDQQFDERGTTLLRRSNRWYWR
jgi:hypothetical protein